MGEEKVGRRPKKLKKNMLMVLHNSEKAVTFATANEKGA